MEKRTMSLKTITLTSLLFLFISSGIFGEVYNKIPIDIDGKSLLSHISKLEKVQKNFVDL